MDQDTQDQLQADLANAWSTFQSLTQKAAASGLGVQLSFGSKNQPDLVTVLGVHITGAELTFQRSF